MLHNIFLRLVPTSLALAALSSTGLLCAQVPTAEQALRLTPVQKGVSYSQPDAAELPKCTVQAEKDGKQNGWVVRGPDGEILRRFVDSNGDNIVDRWSYYLNGLEVYRDIDSNFNGKADQYRWFHTGGTRWGIDKNENGVVDEWRVISAEEVAAEVVAALQTRDAARFARLLITAGELESLGVGPERTKELTAKAKDAASKFAALAARQKSVGPQTKYLSFGGTQPGIVPAGVDDSKRDLIVYENVAALIETDGKHDQIHIGTLVRVGNVWKLIDLPQLANGEEIAASGYFFRASLSPRPEPGSEPAGGLSESVQKILTELERIDAAISQASPAQQGELNVRRSRLLERLAEESSDPAQRAQWLRQLADTASAAVQSGTFPQGIDHLKALEAKLEKGGKEDNLVAYVKFRRLTASYGQDLQQPKADYAKIQEQWLKDLEEFVKTHPRSQDGAEAMLQLAIAQEFAGEDDQAKAWYSRILKDFPTSLSAKKAAGAKTRLESIGKPIQLKGTGLDGKPVDLAQYQGKTVLIQYWATWCEPCKADMERLKDLQAKYADRGFAVIGVSLDHENDRDQMLAFLKQERIGWPQIHEPGGLESRLANELGILTLPTMILIDKSGRVVSRNIHVTELETELKKL